MKTLLALLFMYSSSTWAAGLGELVGSRNCDSFAIDLQDASRFIVSNDPQDNRVGIVFQLVQDYEGDPVYQDFHTGVLKTVHRSGTQVVTDGGVVCANYESVGVFGSKDWVDTYKCAFQSQDHDEQQPGPDGIGQQTVCVRDYYLFVR